MWILVPITEWYIIKLEIYKVSTLALLLDALTRFRRGHHFVMIQRPDARWCRLASIIWCLAGRWPRQLPAMKSWVHELAIKSKKYTRVPPTHQHKQPHTYTHILTHTHTHTHTQTRTHTHTYTHTHTHTYSTWAAGSPDEWCRLGRFIKSLLLDSCYQL